MGEEQMKQEGEKPDFTGKYHHVKSEGFEDFLRENGMCNSASSRQ